MNRKQWIKLSWDIAIGVGLTVFVYGLWRAWQPLGFIVGGLTLAAVALFAGYSLGEFRSRT